MHPSFSRRKGVRRFSPAHRRAACPCSAGASKPLPCSTRRAGALAEIVDGTHLGRSGPVLPTRHQGLGQAHHRPDDGHVRSTGGACLDPISPPRTTRACSVGFRCFRLRVLGSGPLAEREKTTADRLLILSSSPHEGTQRRPSRWLGVRDHRNW